MGFGGAFVALADDATAAFANPSGLVQLTRPEVSAEGRRWGYSTPYTAGGRLEGVPSGIGLDTEVGLRIAESSVDITGLSFLSFVYPTGDWSFAVYRHQLATFELSAQINALFADPPAPEGVDPGFAGVVRDQDLLTSLDFESVSYGIAAAYRVAESFRLGVGLSYSQGAMLLDGEEYLPDDDSIESYFAVGSYLPERMEGRDSVTIDSADWTLSAGFLWSVTPRWHLGGFYRQGPGFELVAESSAGPADPFFPTGTVSSQTAFPDVYGLGVAYRSSGGHLTIAFEWDRVEYSTILGNLGPALRDPGAELKDGSEFHLGSEYVFLSSTPVIALRLGAWLDPDHRVRSVGDEPFGRALLGVSGDDKIHYSAGFGLAFKSFQIDLGIDLSDSRKTASVSAIYSF
jgi:long-subunit fatty acid transport protein